jgi:predicted ATPase/class 3 adenylate cyclase/Flp pilus assembly protein TadD
MADMPGSDALWSREAGAMSVATARYDEMVQAALKATGGRLVKPRGDGESLMFTYTVAADAVTACCHLLYACLCEQWSLSQPLLPRFAILKGEGQLRGQDYLGSDLNRCARLRAITHPGQIVLSETAREAVGDMPPPLVSLKPLGAHYLKDFENAERVWQVVHPDLPSDFPRLNSPNQHNLPASSTKFVGRENEIHEALERLSETRLLTLTGSGGCGKTRLSMEIAFQQIERLPDGVWFIELAPLSSAALVARSVAQVLKINDRPGKNVTDTLAEEIGMGRMLLILDNCEHVLRACSELCDCLLEACPNLKVLASSREPLGVRGEMTYRVPSLSIPDPRRVTTPEDLLQCESVALFLDRVRMLNSDFSLTPEVVAPIAQICHRLDGIPLALELAAARTRSLPVAEIATRLDNRFRLLTGGSRSALPRQQTLRALIDWSYELLNEAERTLLCRFAVFAGGWRIDAAQAVCTTSDMNALEMQDRLTSLVEKSLVLQEERGGQLRYRLLETVRQYGLDRLMERGEGILIREQHRDYFLRHVQQCASLLLGSLQAAGLERLELEHDNIRRALEWSLGEPEGADKSLRFVGNLWRFWMMHGHLNEGRSLLSEALEQPGGKPKSTHRASALNGAGVLAWSQADYVEAHHFLEQSLTMRRDVGDREGVAQSLNNLGLVYMEQGEYATARTLYEEALEIRRDIEDENGIHISLNNLGNLAYFLGDYDTAERYYQESLSIRRKIGDRQNMSHSLFNLGLVMEQKGDVEQAQRLHEESLALRRELDDPQSIAYSLNSLAGLSLLQRDMSAAEAYLAESHNLFVSLGDKRGLVQVGMGLSDVALAQGNLTEAEDALRESLTRLVELKDRWSTARLLDSLVALLQAQGRSLAAVKVAGATQALRKAIGAPRSSDTKRLFEESLEALKRELSITDFEKAWREGENLSIEEVLPFAQKCLILEVEA